MRTLLIILGVCLGVQACTVQEVKPWQRGYLARPEMGWDPDTLNAAQRSQNYFSKEASSGGASAGGGGCGCN